MKQELFDAWVMATGLTDPHLVKAFYVTMTTYPNADRVLTFAKSSSFSADKMRDLLSAQGVDTSLIDKMLQGNPNPTTTTEPIITPVWVEAPPRKSTKSRADRIRLRRQLSEDSEPQEAKDNLFKRLFGKKKKGSEAEVAIEDEGRSSGKSKKSLILMVLAGILFLAVVGGGWYLSVSNNRAESDDLGFVDTNVFPTDEGGIPTGNPETTPTITPPESNEPESLAEQKDRSFWSELISKEVPELSPGNLNNQLSAKTAVGLILMVVLTLWSWGEGSIRRKSQQGANYFTLLGLLAGWLTMPILVLITQATQPGWVMIGIMIVVWLWSNATSTIRSQSDLTPFLTALGLFTATLFYYGKLEFISTLGALFGATWTSWTGVTTVLGVLTLLFTGRGMAALLTILIIILGLIVIVLASLEVGKKHGKGSAFFIALLILLTFALSNWGLSAGVEYLVQTQNTSVVLTVVLNILAPILAWIGSLLMAVGIGVALGDTEVGRTENRQALGLQKTGTFLQNIADFGILGTLIPLFFGVIIIIF